MNLYTVLHRNTGSTASSAAVWETTASQWVPLGEWSAPCLCFKTGLCCVLVLLTSSVCPCGALGQESWAGYSALTRAEVGEQCSTRASFSPEPVTHAARFQFSLKQTSTPAHCGVLPAVLACFCLGWCCAAMWCLTCARWKRRPAACCCSRQPGKPLCALGCLDPPSRGRAGQLFPSVTGTA